MYVCIRIFVCICVYTYVYMCVYICVYAYVCMCVHICILHMSLFLFEAHNSGSPLELNIKKRFHWLLWEQAACAYEVSL